MSETRLDPITPPTKFSRIESDLYRGAYPRPINYRFLERLHLKTMISMMPDPITLETDPALYNFAKANNINIIHIEINKDTKDKGKKRGIAIDQTQVIKIIELILHAKNNPTLLFCNNGGQLTSLVIACLRKLQFWSSVSIFNEFLNYSTTINHNDRLFVENFKAKLKLPKHNDRVDWIWNGISSNIIENHPSLQVVEDDQK